MIRVVKDWGIDADGNSYLVGKIKIRYNEKLGKNEEYLVNPKFPMDIKSALRIILDTETRDLVMRNNMSLTEAIEKVSNLQKEFTVILNKTLKETL
jgi:hypothetical protein